MIIEYKSKEQIKDEGMEELRQFFSEKDFDRWVRINKNAAEGNDRIAISNNFLNLKFKLRDIYKDLDKWYKEKRRTKEVLDLDYVSKSTREE